ncbi:M12 family metallopeptidase [Paludibacterium purpuratum]|uniref:Astacin (Peptidase family M12A) n=1 Tax=Paludibacterium purpuratum TaxID=1144873 RepID=A0A4R7B7Y6_9NEIS|nr:M12 family metallopeptidase [Paludibacterium purpuratum]TDR79885.1 astacin (peptidase family M12A) [Paludibacterium purpuratum]
MRYFLPALLGAAFDAAIAATPPTCPQTASAPIANSERSLSYCVVDGMAVLDDIILGSHDTIQRQGLPPLEVLDWHLLRENPPDIAAGQRAKRQTSAQPSTSSATTWPRNTLVYAFDRLATPMTRQVILQAMQGIESQTHVRFRERTTEADYVSISTLQTKAERPELCGLATVGRVGGRQRLDLFHPGPSWGSCETTPIARHELQHALGFYHNDIDSWKPGLTAREIKAINLRYPASALDPSAAGTPG